MNTTVDNGPANAANIATSKYLNNTTTKTNPASSIENIMTLSKGFLRNIIPNAPITIKAIAIIVTKNSTSITPTVPHRLAFLMYMQ